jgi:hypothetical protein
VASSRYRLIPKHNYLVAQHRRSDRGRGGLQLGLVAQVYPLDLDAETWGDRPNQKLLGSGLGKVHLSLHT